MYTETQRVQLVTWFFIILLIVVGVGAYWFWSGEFQSKAAETINASKSDMMVGDNLGLVGYWTFDGGNVVWSDTTTEIKDVSSNSKHGDAQGSLATTSVRAGKTGQALSFNGTSDLVSLGNVYNGVKTIAFWVKPNTTTQPFIDLNATATINVTAGTVAANNFTSPTVYVDGALPQPTPPAYRSSSATTYATRTNTTLTAPSGIQDGDLLVIIFDIGASSPPTPTPPAGFSVLPNFSSPMAMNDGSFTVNMYAWYKFASSESGNYTVTHSSSASQGYITALTGANPTTPFAPNPTKNTGTGTTTTATGLTTPYDNSLVMFVSSDWGDTTNNLTGPGGSTPTFTKRMGATSQSGILYVADGVLATAGATGNKTITNNTTGGNLWGGVLISVQPLAVHTNWHHVAITTATGINASAVNLGKIASSYFGGLLDDVRFYSSELSATQIADLYQSTNAGEHINAGADNMLTSGLVGYWTFDGNDTVWSDTSTEIKDVSGQGNDGDAVGLTAASVTRGKLGQGMGFDGSEDYIEVSGPSLSTTTYSVSLWVNPSSNSQDDYPLVGDDGYYSGIFLQGTSTSACSNQFRVNFYNGTNHCGSTSLNVNQWSHIVVSNNGGSATFYLNGLVDGGPFSMGSYKFNNFVKLIGMDADDYFPGKIDDVRIYNRALSETEIVKLYNLGK